MLGFNNLSIEVSFLHYPEQNLNSVIRKSSSKLDLVIFETTFFTLKGWNDDLPKERNFRHKEDCFAVILAIDTHALYCDWFSFFFDVSENHLWGLLFFHCWKWFLV